jgi:hypothetical protein
MKKRRREEEGEREEIGTAGDREKTRREKSHEIKFQPQNTAQGGW